MAQRHHLPHDGDEPPREGPAAYQVAIKNIMEAMRKLVKEGASPDSALETATVAWLHHNPQRQEEGGEFSAN